ncbi:MAG TPA: pilin, partial [bacterium]|nr:pilin [bacterium]
MWKKFNLISVFFAFLASFFRASFAHAQDFGLQPVDEVIMLANGDPRVIIGRIISIVLTFLGVIALLLIIYAGFLWMTSGGEEEKIRRAKNVLKNAAIGLLIIFSSWALT